MDIVIEHACVADAEELLAYMKQVGAESDNLSFGAEGLPLSTEAEADYIARMENSADDFMLVARADGHIIGIAGLSRLPRRMKHRGELSVAVAKEYWGRGVGRRLTESIITLARDNSFDTVELQVRSDNLRAVRLYEKCGFQKLFTFPDYFKINGKGFDADYMCLRIER